MLAADFAVQIKLMIMYAIGISTIAILLIYLHHHYHKWINNYMNRLMIIEVIMVIIFIITIQL